MPSRLPQESQGAKELCLSSFQTLPELCSRQDELDFLMEALIIRCMEGVGGDGGRSPSLHTWAEWQQHREPKALCSFGVPSLFPHW